VPSSWPLNPTVLFVVVLVVWALVEFAFSGPWPVTLLVAAVAVNALLWLHSRWARRRMARAVDPSRPYSREDEPA
jgi:membrane protein implicated in regulation of membrane protease activity